MLRAGDITGVERRFGDDEIIVSKTDLKGRITYVNRVFMSISGFTERELLGQPHSVIRHPDMPRSIFKLFWDTLLDGREVFAYVKNRCKSGDHYWVLAHATPSYDAAGTIVGYHSNRRVPDRRVLEQVVEPLYRGLLDEENRHADRKEGLLRAHGSLMRMLETKGVAYDRWVFSL